MVLLLPLKPTPRYRDGVPLPRTQEEARRSGFELVPGTALEVMILESSTAHEMPAVVTLCRQVASEDQRVFFIVLFPTFIFQALHLGPGAVCVLCAYTSLPSTPALSASPQSLPVIVVLSPSSPPAADFGGVGAGSDRVSGTVVRTDAGRPATGHSCFPALNPEHHANLVRTYASQPPFTKRLVECHAPQVRGAVVAGSDSSGTAAGDFRRGHWASQAIPEARQQATLLQCVTQALPITIRCSFLARPSRVGMELLCLRVRDRAGFTSVVCEDVQADGVLLTPTVETGASALRVSRAQLELLEAFVHDRALPVLPCTVTGVVVTQTRDHRGHLRGVSFRTSNCTSVVVH
jgi:hypothetical protein